MKRTPTTYERCMHGLMVAIVALAALAGAMQMRKRLEERRKDHEMKPCTISDILSQLSADELNELDRQTAEVVRAVESTGKSGAFTLKVVLKKNGTNSTLVGMDLKTTIPRPAATARVLFFDYDSNLHATGKLSENPPSQEAFSLEPSGPKLVAIAKK